MTPTRINLSNADWSFTYSSPNSIGTANELDSSSLQWLPAQVPGTVAQSLRLAGQEKSLLWSETDNYDWWYRCEFSHSLTPNSESNLIFEGLATIAEVWLNNKLIISTQNMFLPESVPITNQLQQTNQLVICFRSVNEFLQQKRPRPRWKTNLVDHQQLRWLRTSLLGRIPGWCPPIKPIGPWRKITLEEVSAVNLIRSAITSNLTSKLEFNAEFELHFISGIDEPITGQLIVGSHVSDIVVLLGENNNVFCSAQGVLSPADLWWPHTHGEPTRLACRLLINHHQTTTEFDLGLRGFKQLQLNRSNGLVELHINQTPIFCRGACWTSADIETLTGTPDSVEKSVFLARDAGLNMLRIGGTMVYESDEFYRLCDEFGILVWQDFMFANMDYPVDDDDFHTNIVREVKAQLNRLTRYACISIYCGNSEVQQQAAMMGQARESWSNPFFDTELKDLCLILHPGAIYFPSTPCEGALPFSVSDGISHYYGVGAYKRPLNDALIANVKFTPETLGFANIPEQNTIDSVLRGAVFTAHDPAWKKTVPRDSSAGWDFEDIRDFYLAQLFKCDPIQLRSHDPQRYLALSRIVTSEIMLRTLANWRAQSSSCRGALIWFYKDLVPGAGWGLLDSNNQTKAAYYGVKRASATLAVYFVDKGLDGLALTLINETGISQRVTLTLKAFKHGTVETLSIAKTQELTQPLTEINVNDWLGYFNDLNYAYGFGPKQQDVLYASIAQADSNEWIHDDTYFVGDYNLPVNNTQKMDIELKEAENSNGMLKITSDSFLAFVHIDIDSHDCCDNYFHLAPNVTRIIKLTAKNNSVKKIKGYITAINSLHSQKFSQ